MKGILFKPDMIKAIVEGRKTVTRRLDHLKEINQEPDKWDFREISTKGEFVFANYRMRVSKFIKPRYQVGEVVYIKEAWTYVTLVEKDPWKDKAEKDGSFRRMPDGHLPVSVWYKSDGYEIGASWSTPLFMPAWAARYFIQITDVRDERLQEITITDAGQEIGWDYSFPIPDHAFEGHEFRFQFKKLWDSINAKPKPVYSKDDKGKKYISHYESYPWAEGDRVETYRGKPHYIHGNPWVFIYGFRKVEK